MVRCSLWALEWFHVRRNLLFLQKSYSPELSTNNPKRRFQTDEAFQLRKDWVFELPLKHDRWHSCFQTARGFIINHVSDTTDYFQVKNGTMKSLVKGKGKGKVYPRTGHEGPKEE